MIQVHFVNSASAALVKTVRASVLAVTDLVGGHTLKALGAQALPAAGKASTADQVLVELPPGIELPGTPGPGLYLVEHLDAVEAEHEILAAPGESGG